MNYEKMFNDVIEAPTEEEALEKFMHLFDLGEEEVKVTCIGEGANA